MRGRDKDPDAGAWRSGLFGAALWLTLCAAALGQQATSDGQPVPFEKLATGREQVERAIEDATHWLIENQGSGGGWGSHHSPRPIEVFCDVPGSHDTFRVGTTSLGVMALWDALGSGRAVSEGARPAIDRAIDHLLEHWDVKRPSGLEHYSVWAYGYGLEALARHLVEAPEDERRARIREVCGGMIGRLADLQDLDGGWGYLTLGGVETQRPSWTSMSFTPATCLLGLASARDAGLEVPEKVWRKAVGQVESCRTAAGSYSYGKLWNQMPPTGINGEQGGACRTPVCNLALEAWQQEVSRRDHRRSLENLLIKHARFQVLSLRRPIPHESWYAISGYFYLYGHDYASRVMQGLGEEALARYSGPLAEAVLVCRQPDGSFWDYPLYSYHKPYGTALALSALTRCRFPAEER